MGADGIVAPQQLKRRLLELILKIDNNENKMECFLKNEEKMFCDIIENFDDYIDDFLWWSCSSLVIAKPWCYLTK